MNKHQRVDSWLVAPRGRDSTTAELRLLCFPFAGGGAGAFRGWAERLPPWIDVGFVRLPGREARIKEPPHRSMDTLIAALAGVLGPYLSQGVPFAFFGHSLGSLVQYALAQRLYKEYGLAPVHLFASGRSAPHVQPPETLVHLLSDNELVDTLVRRYDGIPAALLRAPELLRLFVPILRADFAVLESVTWAPGPRLACAVSAYGGSEDPQLTRAQLAAWGDLVLGESRVRMFAGKHFYFQDTGTQDALLDDIVDELTRGLIPV